MNATGFRAAEIAMVSAMTIGGIVIGLGKTNAGVMRHDVPGEEQHSQEPFIRLGADYDAVGRIQLDAPGGQRFGAGTLVSPTQILTAAHLFDENFDSESDVDTTSVTFYLGDDVSNPDYTLTGIESININPHWKSGLGQHDMALITLDTPITVIQPAILADNNPISLLAAMIGFGDVGFGDGDLEESDGVKRGTTNVIDTYASDPVEGWALQVDFDRTGGGYSTFGSDEPTLLEGTAAAGDGGMPLLANFYGQEAVVGIFTAGYNEFGEASLYGDVALFAALQDESNLTFLRDSGLSVLSLMPVPEPSAAILCLVGLLVLSGHRKR